MRRVTTISCIKNKWKKYKKYKEIYFIVACCWVECEWVHAERKIIVLQLFIFEFTISRPIFFPECIETMRWWRSAVGSCRMMQYKQNDSLKWSFLTSSVSCPITAVFFLPLFTQNKYELQTLFRTLQNFDMHFQRFFSVASFVRIVSCATIRDSLPSADY